MKTNRKTTSETDKKILAWHVVGHDRRLNRPHNGSRCKVKKGLRLSIPTDHRTHLCVSGLHASVRLQDALRYFWVNTTCRRAAQNYGPSRVICRVELHGDIKKESDKMCARHRKVLAWLRITPKQWARMGAADWIKVTQKHERLILKRMGLIKPRKRITK